MGRDKATVELAGITLARRGAERLAEVCSVVVVADAGRGVLPGFPSLPDAPAGGRVGPAGGLLGAARACPGRTLLALACDLPGVPVALLATLARRPAADLVIPRSPRGLEPLVARYTPAALAALARRVAAGDASLHGLLGEPGLEIEIIAGAALAAHGDPRAMFANLNTPQDLERLVDQGSGTTSGVPSTSPGQAGQGQSRRKKSKR